MTHMRRSIGQKVFSGGYLVFTLKKLLPKKKNGLGFGRLTWWPGWGCQILARLGLEEGNF